MNFPILETIGSIVSIGLALITIYNSLKYKSRLKKITTEVATFEFEAIEEEKLQKYKSDTLKNIKLKLDELTLAGINEDELRSFKTGILTKIEKELGQDEFKTVEKAEIEKMKSDAYLYVDNIKSNIRYIFLGLFFLWLLSVCASPFYAKFFCSQLIADNSYNLYIQVLKKSGGQNLPISNAVIEINGNSDFPPTDLEGKSVVMFHQHYSKFPGCECPDKNLLQLSIIEENGKITKRDENLTTEWFLKQKSNPSTLIIFVD